MSTSTDVVPGTSEPGGHAEGQYRKLRAEYRRRIRKVTWPLLALALTSSFVGYLRTDLVTYLLSFFGGGMFVLFLAWRDLLPAHIEHWAQGAEGERGTARQLERLPAGWHVWHDLNGPRGNIDHLVIGPAGVFVLDTKNWSGRLVTFENGVPVSEPSGRPGGRTRHEAVPATMRARSAAQVAPLAAALGRRLWVQAVVVLWAETERPITETNRVTYVNGGNLSDWLLRLPPRLSAADVAALARAVGGQ